MSDRNRFGIGPGLACGFAFAVAAPVREGAALWALPALAVAAGILGWRPPGATSFLVRFEPWLHAGSALTILAATWVFEFGDPAGRALGAVYAVAVAAWVASRLRERAPVPLLTGWSFGAAAGLAIAVWAAPVALGRAGSGLAAGGLHFMLFAWSLVNPRGPEPARERERSVGRPAELVGGAAASIAGAAVLAALVVLVRPSLYQPGSVEARTMPWVAAALGFAVGAGLSGGFRSSRRTGWGATAFAAAVPGAVALLARYCRTPGAGAWDGPWTAGTGWNAIVTASVVGLPVAAFAFGLGAWLDDAPRGGRARRLAASAAGASLGGALAASALAGSMVTTHGILAVAAGIAAVSLAFRGTLRRSIAGLVVIACAVLAWRAPALWRPNSGIPAGVPLRSGHGIVAVVDDGDYGRWLWRSGSWIDGTSAARDRERTILAFVPAALAGGDDRTLLIGAGTGRTVEVLAERGDARSVVVAEPFASTLRALTALTESGDDPFAAGRAIAHVGPPADVLRAHPGPYDAILFDPYDLRRAVDARVLRLESLERLRDALAPDGCFALWVPLAGLHEADFRTLLATVTEVFPEVHAAYFPAEPAQRVLLVGATTPRALDVERWDAWSSHPVAGPRLRALDLEDPAAVVAAFRAGRESLRAFADDARVHDGDGPRLESEPLRRGARAPSDGFARWLRETSPGALEVVGAADGAFDDRKARRLAAATFLTRGHLHLWNGRAGAARHEYRRAMEAAPRARAPKALLGFDPETEAALVARAEDGDVAAHAEWARRLSDRGALEDAERQWRRVVAAAPDDVEAAVGLAQTLERAGRRDEAFEIYEELWTRDLDPRARVLVRRVAQVNRWARERAAGGDESTVLSQVDAFLDAEDPFRAMRVLQRDPELDRSPVLLERLGSLYLEHEMHEDALDVATRWNALDLPGAFGARLAASVRRAYGDDEAAWALWSSIPDADHSAESRFLGAQLLLDRGEREAAREQLALAVEAGGDPFRFRAMKDEAFVAAGLAPGGS